MAYGPNSPIEDRVTVGAENADGTAGGNYYVDTSPATIGDEEGTPPLEGDVLGMFSAPAQRSAATITYQLRGDKVGKYANTRRADIEHIRGHEHRGDAGGGGAAVGSDD